MRASVRGGSGVELVIGDKAWSSWSMRPWLALKRAGAPFRETLVRLRRPDTAAAIAAEGSPSGRVPVLKLEGGLVLWDSLAICEWAADPIRRRGCGRPIRTSARWPGRRRPRCTPASPRFALTCPWT